MAENSVVASDRTSPLTTQERKRLDALCATVRKGMETFVEVGAALREINESGLYRERWPTFEEFVQSEFGISRFYAYRQIAAAETVEMLPIGNKPENEAQVRPLTELPPRQRPRAWKQAVKEAAKNGSRVTAAGVRKVVNRIKGKEPEGAEEIARKIIQSTNGRQKDPEPDDDSPDITTEYEHEIRENTRLRELVETLQTGKAEKELAKLSDRYARLEGRLQQEMTTRSEAEKDAKYAKGMLAKIRRALGVEADREIMDAIRDFKR